MALTVLFVCVRNAGRSQMAEALFNELAPPGTHARSAGSRPAAAVHPEVVAVMREVGVDLSQARPKSVSEAAPGSDVVVTMGCGDECPVVPGAQLVEWDVPDPAGLPLENVRAIRDDLAARVRGLLVGLAELAR